MPENVAASMTASIVIDKTDLLSQILKGLSEGQRELENNKLEMYFDFSNSKNKTELEKILQQYRKELTSKDFVVQIKNQGVEETVKSLDKLLEIIKLIASGKAFGTGAGNGKGIGNSIVDEKQLDNIIELFNKIESHLTSIKKVVSDVGDGEEFSPLLKTINNINTSISQLSSNVKGIGLNMNIDFGSDKELEAKAEAKISNALQAYQNLFEHIKMSGAGGSVINTKFFDFDINQFDTPMSKLQAYIKFIKDMREEAKQAFGSQDVLYTDTDKKFWDQASSAKGQVTKIFNEIKASTDTNPLENIFGKTDLSDVIEQLNTIVSKLDEISNSAKGFTEAFKDGLNVNASVEEIEKLTNRVKELEDELAKIKTPTVVTPQESNISSEVSAFQQQEKIQNQVTQSIQEQNKAIDESIKKTLTLNDVRQKQWEIIQKTNPKEEGTNSTWVDKPEDAKTFYEVNHKDSDYPFNENYSDDWTVKDKMNVEATGKITVYSSYPIEDGNWVTPSKEEGLSYAGSGKLYSATMDPRDIAWVDAGQGQVAHISDELKEVIDLSTKAETQVQSIDNNTNETGEQSTLNALDDTIAKYETIVSLVKEYYDLSNNKKDTIGISSDDERISEIRKQLKSYTKNPDYNGEYKMGFGGSGKNIFTKSVDLSQEEMLQEICNMLGVEIPKNADKAKEAIEEVTSATVTTEPKKDAFPDKDASASVKSATNSIKEENNVLEQNTQKVKENTQAKEQNANANLNKYDKRLDSYNGKVDKYQATIDRFKDGGWTSDTYLKNVQAVRDAVKQYATLLGNIKTNQNGIASDEDIQNLDKYEKKIKDTIATVTNMSASEKGYSQLAGQKEIDKINKILRENSAMSSEAKAKIKAYKQELISGNPSVSLEKIHGEIMKIVNAEELAGRAGRSFFDTLKNSGFHQIAAQMAGMFGVYDVINIGRNAFNIVKELDYALVDLKKTTAMNESQLESYYYDSNTVAKQMGVTTKEIIDQSSAWSRLGYNTAEASKTMAQLSSQFASISPGMDTTTSQEGLVSIMKAWNIGYQDVKSEIMDNINALGNSMAEDNQDVVEGMERSAAALAAVGTSYQDAFAMFSGIQEVLQNAEVSGRALRSIAMRIRGYDESTEELSEDLKNVTGELTDLTKTAEHTQGVSIFKEGSTTEFKSLVDYFGEIHDIWNEMSQKQQNDFLQKAFGKTQAQAGAALIQNYSAVTKSLDVMDNAAGSSDREMETVKQSITYKLNELKETWVGTVQDIANRKDLSLIISGLIGISKGLGFVIGKLGLIPTVIAPVVAILGKGKSSQRFCPVW